MNGRQATKKVLREGEGSRTPIKGSKVTVLIKHVSGPELESTAAGLGPIHFMLGANQVVSGLDNIISTMKKGELCIVEIPPSLGYGDGGFPTNIPPQTSLVYEVEVVDFNNDQDFFDGKVVKTVLEAGDGWKHPKFETSCQVSMRCMDQTDGSLLFDSGESSLEIVIGSEDFSNKGLDKCLQYMHLHERCTSVVPSDLAFGAKGYSGSIQLRQTTPEGTQTQSVLVCIPENTSLIYELTLLGFEKPKKSWQMESVAEHLNAAEQRKKEGNQFFERGNYPFAIRKYNRTIDLFDFTSNFSDEEHKQKNDLKLVCHLNICACYIQLKEFKKAYDESNKALAIDSKSVKALWRRGSVAAELGDLEAALADFETATRIDPANKSVRVSLASLNKRILEQQRQEAATLKRMFDQK